MKTAGRPFSCPASSASFLLLTRLQCTPNAFGIRAMLGFATLTRIERFLAAQHALRFGLSEEAWQHSLVVYPSHLDRDLSIGPFQLQTKHAARHPNAETRADIRMYAHNFVCQLDRAPTFFSVYARWFYLVFSDGITSQT